MGVLTHAMVHTMTLLNTTVNGYGDIVDSAGTDYSCHFREITEIDHVTNREDINADALLWVESTTPVVKGSVIQIEDDKYIVERLTKARRLGSTDVLFIKCLLEKYNEGTDS